MQKIKTLLVDDEYLALNLLEEFIRKDDSLEIVAKVKSPMKAIEVLNTKKIDLLFLDVQMPTLSGTNLLKAIKNPPITIFTTAYADFAVEAFNLNAIDYLLKPFSFDRFVQALNKAKEQLHIQHVAPPTMEVVQPKQSQDFFSVKVDGKITKIYFDQILFVEGLKEYVKIVCLDARHVILESLKRLEEILPMDGFIRVHKSYIVAKNKVERLDGNLLEIRKFKIPISRTRKEEVVQQIFFE